MLLLPETPPIFTHFLRIFRTKPLLDCIFHPEQVKYNILFTLKFF